ncbi:unnamed protein product [Spirodela intermedia]|uniref:RING-type domain-containing protein n=1 Tax=Spirodela intermedia TaxID=51605 RepID=A0A7I8KB96_SPIIN|nr:unnamed protein product [Spirodela intermedia]
MAAQGGDSMVNPPREADLSAGVADGQERDSYVFFPVMLGVIRAPVRDGEEAAPSPAADRIVMVSPLTRGAVVLIMRGDRQDLAAMMEEILAAEGGAAGPPPASKASVDALRTVKRPEAGGGEEEMQDCAVCLDGLWEAEEEEKCGAVKEMPCGHRFHGGCIEKWLSMHGLCPLCRHRMPEEERAGGKKGGEEEEIDGDFAERQRRAVERTILAAFGFNWAISPGLTTQPRQQ